MPYDPKKYPKNWKAIAHSIKDAASWKCQYCDKLCRRPGQTWDDFQHYLYKSVSEALALDCLEHPQRYTLTVAHHPDPNPMNCDLTNLLALCSVCHLRLDAKMHGENAARTRKRKQQEQLEASGQLRLF